MEELSEITPLPAEGRVQVRTLVRCADGPGCFRYDFFEAADAFTAYVEDPARGGAPGLAAPWRAHMGW